MAFAEWSVYAVKLRQCAERMSGAATVEDVRSSVIENARLWAQLEDVLSERLEKTSTEWQTLHNRARYVAEVVTGLPKVTDTHLQTCIAINRQSADMMPLLELSTTDFKLVRN